MIIGIDIGITGAIVGIEGHEVLFAEPMPTISIMRSGKLRHDYFISGIFDILRKVSANEIRKCAFEVVYAPPIIGSMAALTLGKGSGIIETVLIADKLPYEKVLPQTWKKYFGLIQTKTPRMKAGTANTLKKNAAVVKAKQLFPRFTWPKSLQKCYGIADALLIAKYVQDKK